MSVPKEVTLPNVSVVRRGVEPAQLGMLFVSVVNSLRAGMD